VIDLALWFSVSIKSNVLMATACQQILCLIGEKKLALKN